MIELLSIVVHPATGYFPNWHFTTLLTVFNLVIFYRITQRKSPKGRIVIVTNTITVEIYKTEYLNHLSCINCIFLI